MNRNPTQSLVPEAVVKELKTRVSVTEERRDPIEVQVQTEYPTTSPAIGTTMKDTEFRSYFRSLFPGRDVAQIAARLNRRPGDVWEILEGVRPPDAGLLKLLGLQVERTYRVTGAPRV